VLVERGPAAEPQTSKASPLGRPKAVRDTEKVPTRPDSKRAVKDAVSSFSTSPNSSETGAALCPTTAPSGSGRLGICVDSEAPETEAMGPATYSAASITCAADVPECAGAGTALEAPAQRPVRVGGVVAPVAAAEQREVAQLTALDVVTDRGDGGGAPEGVPDGGHDVGGALQLGHRAGVLERPGEGLLAQHVLARGDQRLGDRPVQRVADDDADGVDRRVLGDGLPAGERLLVAVPAGGVLAERDVGVGYRGQADRRQAARRPC
jgi:hypothetical protein